jgi:hypothetical protein
VTDVNEKDKASFKKFVQAAMADFNNNAELMEDSVPIFGHKSRLAAEARQRVIDREIVQNA